MAMIQFVPGLPWEDGDERDAVINNWRDLIRHLGDNLKMILGEPVYCFAKPGDADDNDDVHRFLWLHWCCFYRPDSPFVLFLVEATGARDVEELMGVLVDPGSYAHPFKMNDAIFGMDLLTCRLEYFRPPERMTVAVVFSALDAQRWAESLLLQQINADVIILAPEELVSEDWIRSATRHCRTYSVRYMRDGVCDGPIDLLARINKLCVVIDKNRTSFYSELVVPASIEDLLCQGMLLDVANEVYYPDGHGFGDPETCLKDHVAHERIAAQAERREAFTSRLKELRLQCVPNGTGLSNAEGKTLDYDSVALPFPLVRRLVAWQRDFDENSLTSDVGSTEWRTGHEHEELEIARELQASLGSTTRVLVSRYGQWTRIGDIAPI